MNYRILAAYIMTAATTALIVYYMPYDDVGLYVIMAAYVIMITLLYSLIHDEDVNHENSGDSFFT